MNHRRGERGQSLVETALILVAFMSLLLAMTAIGEKLYVRQELTQRAHDAARWGALNRYDADAIRNLVRYGTTAPANDAGAFDSLKPTDVVVTNPGCPGPDCRIRVAIPAHGVQSVEPVERTD
jgi:Flp pilus assembly protein TadG